MTIVELRPRTPGTPDWWEPRSPLGHARGLLAADRRQEARVLLERALERDELDTVFRRATALLALGLIASEDGDDRRAATMFLRAEAELALKRAPSHAVRWDIALARAQQLSEAGMCAEAAAVARTAIAQFEDSGLCVAYSRPVLLGLKRLAVADGAYDAAFMVPRAVGALQLRDEGEARDWVGLQHAIRDELLGRGDLDTAARHVAVAACAMPFDLLGTDSFWREVCELLAPITGRAGHRAWRAVVDAFNALERQWDALLDYEEEAPLLPRERVVARW